MSFAGCKPEQLAVRHNGRKLSAKRLLLPATHVRFQSDEVELSGTLVLPASGQADTIVVWVTGSDQTPDVDHVYWQYILPINGVGVFVFDKRGTGQSGGSHTANFHLRASDVGAAVKEVRRLAGKTVRVGLFGVSQGGWVAPLAASKAAVDFTIVGYGLAEGVPAEDRDEIIQNLKTAGFGSADITEAMELQAAATKVVVSHWQSGWQEFDTIRAKYKGAKWLSALGNDGYTAFMTKMSVEDLKQLGPKLDQGVSFEYDPLPTIASLTVPQLWILGAADTSAPSARTQQILSRLQFTGLNLDLVVFPKANHGVIEREMHDGVRRVRTSPGYWELVSTWARTREVPRLPNATVQRHGESTRLDQ